MRKPLIVLALLMISVFLFGCSSVNQGSAAKEVVRQYKTYLYNIEDYNKAYKNYTSNTEGFLKSLESYKGYFTEEGYNKFIVNRTAIFPIEACAKGKHNLKVTNITFDKVTVENKDKLILDYTIHLKAVYQSEENVADEKSQATLVKENNEWKISNDWFYVNDLFQSDLNFPKR